VVCVISHFFKIVLHTFCIKAAQGYSTNRHEPENTTYNQITILPTAAIFLQGWHDSRHPSSPRSPESDAGMHEYISEDLAISVVPNGPSR
jgi:hypothetical protein